MMKIINVKKAISWQLLHVDRFLKRKTFRLVEVIESAGKNAFLQVNILKWLGFNNDSDAN
jgi:hypothetical protein